MARVVLFEMNSQDPKRAASFYSSVFGWKINTPLTKAHIAYEVADLHAVEQLLKGNKILIYESVPSRMHSENKWRIGRRFLTAGWLNMV